METNLTVADRVKRLYGTPGFETWGDLARALRLPAPGSAYSLAHGLRKPDRDTEMLLDDLEFRARLPQAANALAALAGEEPVYPKVYSRAQAHEILKRRRK